MKRIQGSADIETASPEYDKRFQGASGRFLLGVQTRIVTDLLADYQGARILDVGGAHAQLAKPLARQGFSITVTGSSDICGQYLARKMEALPYTYITCDSQRLPFADNSFPIVLSFRLLTHTPQWQNFLAEMCRVSENIVLLDYPDVRSFNIFYKYLFRIKKTIEGNTRTFLVHPANEYLD